VTHDVGELAPHGVGRIAGHAIRLSVRRFVPLFAAGAVVWLPLAIVQAFTLVDLGPIDWRALFAAAAAQHPPSAELQAELARLHRAGDPTMLLSAMLTPLGNVAVIVTAAGFVDGAPVALSLALRRAARLWVPALVVALLFEAMTIVIMAVAAVILAVLAVAGFFLAFAIFHPNAASLVVASAVIPMLAAFAILFAIAFVSGMAYVALAVEDPNPIRAVASALRRALDRPLFRRTMFVGIGYGAIQLVVGVAFTVAWLSGAFMHSGPIVAVTATLGGSMLSVVLLVFVLLYTRDIRFRREGADVLLAVDDAGISDRELIERFLARRDSLAPQARAEVAARIGRTRAAEPAGVIRSPRRRGALRAPRALALDAQQFDPVAGGERSRLHDRAIDAHHVAEVDGQRARERAVALAGFEIVRRRDAAFDRLDDGQLDVSDPQPAADEVGFTPGEPGRRGGEEVGPKAHVLHRCTGQCFERGDPGVEDQRDRVDVEVAPTGVFAYRDDPGFGGGLHRAVHRRQRVQSRVLLAAVRLPGAAVSRAHHDERRRPIAGDAVGEDVGRSERLTAQRLDREAVDRRQRTDLHATGFGAP